MSLSLTSTSNQKAYATTVSYPDYISLHNTDFQGVSNTVDGMSSNGQYVLFISSTNSQVYLNDRSTATTRLISSNSAGVALAHQVTNPRISADGQKFFFNDQRRDFSISDSRPNEIDLYQKDITTGAITNISDIAATTIQPFIVTYSSNDSISAINTSSIQNAFISDDGNSIFFHTNYAITCGNALCTDNSAYLLNLQDNVMSDVASYTNKIVNGSPIYPSGGYTTLGISGDGRYLLYTNSAPSSIDSSAIVVRYDTHSNTAQTITTLSSISYSLKVSDDGNYIAYIGDIANNTPGYIGDCTSADSAHAECLYVYRLNINSGVLEVANTNQDGSIPGQYKTDGPSISLSGDGNTIVWATNSIMRSTNTRHMFTQLYSKNMTTRKIHVISVNTQDVPSDGPVFNNSYLTYDGSEAAITVDAANFGAPLYCMSSGDESNPNIPIPCDEVYVVSTAPSDIVDNNAPDILGVTWSQPVVQPGGETDLSIKASDNLSGVAGGEYYIGSDPGLGNATSLIYDSVQKTFTAYIGGGTTANTGNITVHFRLYDNVGNWTPINSLQLIVQNDSNPPVLGSPTWSQNPKPTNIVTSLTLPATDDNTGIKRAEYYIGDIDPGQGNGIAMQLSNLSIDGLSADITATFGTDLTMGIYKVNVRAEDNADNWSVPVTSYLIINSSKRAKMIGHQTVTPSLAKGDVLPGLISINQTDVARLSFNVKYTKDGILNDNSKFSLGYRTGTKCNKPTKAINCHTLSLKSSGIEWMLSEGNNGNTGILQGTGILIVDGQSSNVQFRVTGVEGTRLNPVSSDQIQVQIYNASSNPNTDTPIYQMASVAINRGGIKIIP